MIVKKLDDVPLADMQGYAGVSKKVVIGSRDGSAEIAVRHFSVEPGGATPHHAHDVPNPGKGRSSDGSPCRCGWPGAPLHPGDLLFIAANEVHHFANTGAGPFGCICIVPRRGEA